MGWNRTRRRTCCRRRSRTGRRQRQAPAPRADGPPDRRPSSASSACYASSRCPRSTHAFSALEGRTRSRVITAQCRRTQGSKKSADHYLETRLAAKILMQQAEQQVVLPDAIDAEITSRQTFAAKSAFLKHPDRRRIGGNAGGLDAVKIEFAEQRRQQYAQRRRHVAAMRVRFSDPVPDGAGLHDAAADVRQRDAADHRAIGFAKHDEGIGSVGGDVFGIAAQPPPETSAAKI